MDFALSAEQRLLVHKVRRFIAQHLEPLETDVETRGVLDERDRRRIFNASRALGFYAMNIPVAHGGGGLSTIDWMLVEEEFGRTSDVLVRRAFGNVYEILLEGTPLQIDRWLKPTVRGERTGSVAFTEPEAGSDAAGIRTRAERNADGYVLSGHKHFISDALYADYFIVTAVTDSRESRRGISTFLVDRGMKGFSIGENQPMMGLRGTTHAALFFDQVQLGTPHLLGNEGEGLALALSTLGRIRLAQVGARAVGKAARLLEAMNRQARQRHQFGRPIGDFQLMQQLLVDSAIEISATRLLLLQTAWMIDQGLEARAQISMVKVQAAEMLGRVADRAVQLFGGSGYCADLPIERAFRDARIYRIFDGTSEIHRSVIGRSVMAGNELHTLADAS